MRFSPVTGKRVEKNHIDQKRANTRLRAWVLWFLKITVPMTSAPTARVEENAVFRLWWGIPNQEYRKGKIVYHFHVTRTGQSRYSSFGRLEVTPGS